MTVGEVRYLAKFQLMLAVFFVSLTGACCCGYLVWIALGGRNEPFVTIEGNEHHNSKEIRENIHVLESARSRSN